MINPEQDPNQDQPRYEVYLLVGYIKHYKKPYITRTDATKGRIELVKNNRAGARIIKNIKQDLPDTVVFDKKPPNKNVLYEFKLLKYDPKKDNLEVAEKRDLNYQQFRALLNTTMKVNFNTKPDLIKLSTWYQVDITYGPNLINKLSYDSIEKLGKGITKLRQPGVIEVSKDNKWELFTILVVESYMRCNKYKACDDSQNKILEESISQNRNSLKSWMNDSLEEMTVDINDLKTEVASFAGIDGNSVLQSKHVLISSLDRNLILKYTPKGPQTWEKPGKESDIKTMHRLTYIPPIQIKLNTTQATAELYFPKKDFLKCEFNNLKKRRYLI